MHHSIPAWDANALIRPPRFRLLQNARTLAAILIAVTSSHVSSAADGLVVPFVSGFERFARHDDLSPEDAGALLISELSCAACHTTDDPWLAPKRGPSLAAAGIRLRPEWLRDFMADPAATKPGTTMPHILSSMNELQRDKAIDALVAFLGSLRKPFETIKATGVVPVVHEFWNRGDSDRGRTLYHTIGCVACHEPEEDYETAGVKSSAIDQLLEQLDPEEIEEMGLSGSARRVESVPHGDLVAKYSRRSLTMFLLQPEKTRPAARMPSFRLSPSEAADLTAHLLDDPPNETATGDRRISEPLAEQGRELFVTLRCVNCHDAGVPLQASPAKPLAAIDTSGQANCIGESGPSMPHYELDPKQTRSIQTFLKRIDSPVRTASQDVRYRMLQLNCFGCHERDEEGGVGRYRKAFFDTVGHVDLGDEGRLPPPLSGVGRKLVPAALAGVFGNQPSRRPHMTIRMPAYSPATVATLVKHFPNADGVDDSPPQKIFGETKTLVDAGRDLVNTGCVECHPFRGEGLPGVVGVDLDGVVGRVHPAWFHEFMLNPVAVKKRTRMPSFFPDGVSNRKDLLDGHVPKQIGSIWAYLSDLKGQPLPDKISEARSKNYELIPTDRPIVLRTFMKEAGTHSIAVGFPEQVHYAFDAENMRLAIAWKGRFLDARGTWFERFTPPADPLERGIVKFPSESSFAVAKDERELSATVPADQAGYQFLGYRLDAGGVPTLLYRFKAWTIEDRIEPTSNDGLRRTLLIRHESGNRSDDALTWRVHASDSLTGSGPLSFVDGKGLSVTVSPDVGHAGELARSENGLEWLIPIDVVDEKRVVVEYTW